MHIAKSGFLLLGLLPSYVRGLDNGLALTPQMGWNTWNHFGCDISEDTILGAADAVISNKLNEIGYECTWTVLDLSKYRSLRAFIDILMDDCKPHVL